MSVIQKAMAITHGKVAIAVEAIEINTRSSLAQDLFFLCDHPILLLGTLPPCHISPIGTQKEEGTHET